VFWDGKDNYGQVVDFEEGPFVAILNLQYAEIGKDRMAPWIKKKAPGIFPNMIFVEKMVAFDDVKLRDYPDGSIYVAHWTPDEIEIDTYQPVGDVIEIYQEGSEYKKKLEFKLGFNLQARVDPERVNAKLFVKCKMKTDRLGERSLEWQGLEKQIDFRKDFGGIPAVDDFGRQNMIFELEYRYKWPDNTNLLISTEEIPETLMVFSQKNDPTHTGFPWWEFASYWNDFKKPNWFMYWREVNHLVEPPYDTDWSKYDHLVDPNEYFGGEGGYYNPSEEYPFDNRYFWVTSKAGRSIRVHNENKDYIGTLTGIESFAIISRHENLHKTQFFTWWDS
jgi:hypothetical protein